MDNDVTKKILDGHTTADIYFVNTEDGKDWSPVRKQLHSRIVKKILHSVCRTTIGEKPIAVFLGGGSASGKSSIRDEIIMPWLNERKYYPVIIDCDQIKELLPPYKDIKDTHPAKAANAVHKESKEVAREVMDKCILERYSLLYDSTMASPPEEFMVLINRLKEKGYYLIIVGVLTDIKKALSRAKTRAEETGRVVPHDAIVYTHKRFPITFWEIEKEFDEMLIYDNNKDNDPFIVAQSEYNDLQVWHKLIYNEFRRRGLL